MGSSFQYIRELYTDAQALCKGLPPTAHEEAWDRDQKALLGGAQRQDRQLWLEARFKHLFIPGIFSQKALMLLGVG